MQQRNKLSSKLPVKQVSLHVPAMKMYEWDTFFGQPLTAEKKESIRCKVKNRAFQRRANTSSVIAWG